MFESLKKKLSALRGKATEAPQASPEPGPTPQETTAAVAAMGDSGRKIDEGEVDELLWELELGLLESDVALPVIEEIKNGVREGLIGKRVDRKFTLDQVVEAALRSAIESVLKKSEFDFDGYVKGHEKPVIIMFIGDFNERIPFTGWSTERVYNILREKIDESNRVVILVLDEIDKLVYKSGDDVLYHLSRINDDLQRAKVSLIGISNDLKFTEFLDPRVKSRLGEEKMVFPPYNAEQLRDILNQRSELAFFPGVIDPGVAPLCSALAAQEHGDARRALDLLRVAAEIAERNGDDKVTEAHVYKAKNKIELDCVTEAIRTLPTQSKLVLMSILLNEEHGDGRLTTGDVYETYRELSQIVGVTVLTQRRVTDLISELDMLGIIHARVKSFGRGGRTKEIESSVPRVETKKILEDDEILQAIKNYRPKNQTTLI